MVPGLGDDIQAIKAGILEIGDIFVVNKADREGADRTARELSTMLDMRHTVEDGWNPKVMKTEAQRGTGIEELTEEILSHRAFFQSSGAITDFLQNRSKRHFISILRDTMLNKALLIMAESNDLNRIVKEMNDHRIDPYSAVEEVISKIMPNRGGV
jgi:LAO/AO transport system kinase